MDESSRLKRNAYMRQWKKKNPERVNALKRAYIKNNEHAKDRCRKSLQIWRYQAYERQLLLYAKRSAGRRGLSFNLELSDIVIPDLCPVLGIPLERPTANGKKRYSNQPSVDRRDNSLGYIKGNVAVISWRANRLKCDGSIAEFEAILSYMKNSTGGDVPSPS